MLTRDELHAILQEKSTLTLQRFKKVATSGVKDEKLLSILEDVKRYWKDSFRPALTMLSCEAVGGQPELADDTGLMFTLISSGFGIHDDIVDNSTSKHLRPTIYGLYGRDSALLVGDLLIFKGWTVINEMAKKFPNSRNLAKIIKIYGELSIEVCEAEFAETLCRKNLDIDLDYYLNMQWKAMAEIEACSRIGAIIGNGKKAEIEALAEFGRRLGAISRLKDDLEDCLNLKFDLPNRIEFESVPLPLLFAAKSSPEKYMAIKKIIGKRQLSPTNARKLLGISFEANAFVYIKNIAKKHEQLGTARLKKIKHNPAIEVLLSMIEISYMDVAELCK
jgi:geranylgeranyl diphosphate synthase type I